MKEPLPDNTVLLIILATILLIFSFIFTFRPSKFNTEPSIQWKDSSITSIKSMSDLEQTL
ncbi:hypothetical protein EV05_1862 [Prochlorococcus sp. MIT 0601]|nr:hypothetical protein EV05_1862 [Prochlorococcus sp. MIT 0601]